MIDFQARLVNNSTYPFLVAQDTARWAMTSLDLNFDWICSVYKIWGGVAWCVESRKTGEVFFSEFDFASRTIDAALLEQIHNEVTAWFTAIKEGASA